VRDELVRDVKAHTGRDLVVAGDTSVSFFPSLAVTMANVSLSPPPGMTGEPTVKIRRIDASVPFSSLFTGRIEVTRLALTDPVFELRIDRQGRRSWEDTAAAPPQPAPTSGAASPSGSGTDSPLRSQSLDDTAIDEIHIVNGTVRYLDERTGVREEAKSFDLTISGGSPGSPFEAKGSVMWRAERIDVGARLASRTVGRPVGVALALKSQRLSADYRGTVTLTNTPELDGELTVAAPSLAGLAVWLGAGAAPARDFGALSFKSRVRSGAASLTLSNTALTLAGASATGSIAIDTSRARPQIRASLEVTALDLDAYSAPASPASGPAKTPPPTPGAPGQETAGPAWSEEKIDLGFLGLADIDAKLALGRLTYGGMKLGETSATLSLKNRVLRFGLDRTQLYEGRGHGVVTVDATAGSPAIGADLVFEEVSILPMLTDASGFDWLAGRGNLQLKLAGQGGSERAIVESLSGSAAVTVVDGAVVGVNIPQIIRGLSQGRLSDFGQVGTEKTDFSEMTASFRIANGVAETQDLRMLSPLMRMTATGTVDIGQHRLDATLRPRLVGSLSGQGGVRDLTGLELPVRLSGPWSDPQLSADIDAVLKDPDKAVEAIKQLGKQLEDSGFGEALRKLLGDDKSSGKSGKSGGWLDELLK
jgi:AsmA protein